MEFNQVWTRPAGESKTMNTFIYLYRPCGAECGAEISYRGLAHSNDNRHSIWFYGHCRFLPTTGSSDGRVFNLSDGPFSSPIFLKFLSWITLPTSHLGFDRLGQGIQFCLHRPHLISFAQKFLCLSFSSPSMPDTSVTWQTDVYVISKTRKE